MSSKKTALIITALLLLALFIVIHLIYTSPAEKSRHTITQPIGGATGEEILNSAK